MSNLLSLLNRVFAALAGIFWLATVLAVGCQVWDFFIAKATQILTVKVAIERLWGTLPTFTNDSAQVIFAIVSGLSLVVFVGLCALAFSALAKVVE